VKTSRLPSFLARQPLNATYSARRRRPPSDAP
jgi:hypothetical protein